jgi:hypothetical protein
MANTPPPNNPPPPSDPPPKPWYDGKADQETVGYMQARGLHDKPADDVALAAIQAHREAERLLGVPKDQLVRLPAANDEAAQRAFWQKFGMPAEAKDYDFPSLKDKDGKVTDAALDQAVRTTAFQLNLPKDAASRFVEAMMKTQTTAAKDAEAALATKLDEGRAELQKNWGANFAAHKIVAQEGAKKLGLDPEIINSLEQTAGYAKTMEALRRVGAASAEDTFVRGNKDVNDGVMTAEQASEKLAQLKADEVWRQRYLNGGVAEMREFQVLTKIISEARSGTR